MVREGSPNIETTYNHVGGMHLFCRKQRYDVIVTDNFGDILTDLELFLEEWTCKLNDLNPASPSMFEPVHGSAYNRYR